MRTLWESPALKSLLALNFLVCGLLLAPQFWPLPQRVTTVTAEITASDIAEFLGAATHEMDDALARPIFHTNRRPPQEAQEIVEVAPVVTKPEFTLELVGVMGAAASRTAFLMDTSSQQTHTVKVGQVVDGWNIIEIDTNTIRLSNDLEEKVLSLN